MIGVISDTHIPRRKKALPREVQEALQKVDLILHAGDILEQGVLEELEELAPVYAVFGNCDPAELQQSLPRKRIIDYRGFKIGLIHGHGLGGTTLGRILDAFREDEVDAIVYGHSHRPHNERINEILIFNPGSPTDKRTEMYYSYGIITVQEDKLVGKIRYFK